MKSFSIYILVVITGVLFISSSPSSSLSEVNRPLKSDVKPKLDQEQIKKKVQRDLRRIRMKDSVGVGYLSYETASVTEPIPKKYKMLPKKRTGVVKDSKQTSLSEVAETFNRKCLEIEALLKEK